MTLQQYELRSGNSTMITWLESGRVKIGNQVTLKDDPVPHRRWYVERAYSKIDSDVLIDQNKAGKMFDSIKGRS